MAGVVVALDVGARRIGVARGDASVRLASPLPALFNDGDILDKLRLLIRENEAETVVIGLPRDINGKETGQSEFTRQFAHDLREVLTNAEMNIEIVFQDEGLTSIEAEELLRKRKNFSEAMLRDGTIDSEAAVVILTDYLEAHRGAAKD
jgi:putative Holliday junction resolvase